MNELPGETNFAWPQITFKRVVGLAICLGGGFLLLLAFIDLPVWKNHRWSAALAGGSVAALATALGTLPVLLSQKFSQRTHDNFLGFGAGVMLAATAFSLVIPAIAASKSQYAQPLAASLIVGIGILLGALLIALLDQAISSDITIAMEGRTAVSVRHAWLFVLAIALHNLPEGLAIGVAYGGVDLAKANYLATGISIQDVPEGLVVALALRSIGHSRLFSVSLGAASGLIEPVAAVVGVATVGSFTGLLPMGLAMAAGAMLFVLCRDVVPESHAHGHRNSATASLLFGFVVMTVLDTALV